MSEVMLGYFEAAFIVLSVVLIAWVFLRAYRPSQKSSLEQQGRIPFREDDDGEA